jgi:predicted GNAT superfamily acetyltransferase
MRQTLEPTLVQRAEGDARDAASRAGIDIHPLETMSELTAASSLIAEVWGTGTDDSQLPPELLRALTHAGNYAAGAYVDGDLVGTVVGFLGHDDDGPYLHSHILGVSKRSRGHHVGFALKQDQRAWALARGLRKVTWTFDPLVRRNAHFNLQKLGADAAEYHENFYGSMSDGINAGDESDRLVIVWNLADDRAVDAASGRGVDEPQDSGTVALSAGSDREPQRTDVAGNVVLCETPADIVELRREDPELALRWRIALRETLGSALNDGYGVSGFTRAGWYVLGRDVTRT